MEDKIPHLFAAEDYDGGFQGMVIARASDVILFNKGIRLKKVGTHYVETDDPDYDCIAMFR